MIRTILDTKENLENLQTESLQIYLQRRGWEIKKKFYEDSLILSKSYGEKSYEILLPKNPDYEDFYLRLYELFENISKIERKSVSVVIKDALSATSDVCRFRIQGDFVDGGSIPLDKAVRICSNLKDSVLSAAWSTLDARAAYFTKRPKNVSEVTSNIKLGQTEVGSYVFTLFSYSRFESLDLNSLISTPSFERAALSKLNQAMFYITQIENPSSLDKNENLLTAVKSGVSANLCDSIIEIIDTVSDGLLEVSFAWSELVEESNRFPSRVIFDYKNKAKIQEVSKILKAKAQSGNREFRGVVTGLQRSENALEGKVKIATFLDGKPKHIHLYLDLLSYQEAVRAHQNDLTIICEGTLNQNGQTLYLEKIKAFKVDDQ
jgi:hypothetical protein